MERFIRMPAVAPAARWSAVALGSLPNLAAASQPSAGAAGVAAARVPSPLPQSPRLLAAAPGCASQVAMPSQTVLSGSRSAEAVIDLSMSAGLGAADLGWRPASPPRQTPRAFSQPQGLGVTGGSRSQVVAPAPAAANVTTGWSQSPQTTPRFTSGGISPAVPSQDPRWFPPSASLSNSGQGPGSVLDPVACITVMEPLACAYPKPSMTPVLPPAWPDHLAAQSRGMAQGGARSVSPPQSPMISSTPGTPCPPVPFQRVLCGSLGGASSTPIPTAPQFSSCSNTPITPRRPKGLTESPRLSHSTHAMPGSPDRCRTAEVEAHRGPLVNLSQTDTLLLQAEAFTSTRLSEARHGASSGRGGPCNRRTDEACKIKRHPTPRAPRSKESLSSPNLRLQARLSLLRGSLTSPRTL